VVSQGNVVSANVTAGLRGIAIRVIERLAAVMPLHPERLSAIPCKRLPDG
jgi:hypothetical protein